MTCPRLQPGSTSTGFKAHSPGLLSLPHLLLRFSPSDSPPRARALPA